jgi:hypothetical protein
MGWLCTYYLFEFIPGLEVVLVVCHGEDLLVPVCEVKGGGCDFCLLFRVCHDETTVLLIRVTSTEY